MLPRGFVGARRLRLRRGRDRAGPPRRGGLARGAADGRAGHQVPAPARLCAARVRRAEALLGKRPPCSGRKADGGGASAHEGELAASQVQQHPVAQGTRRRPAARRAPAPARSAWGRPAPPRRAAVARRPRRACAPAPPAGPPAPPKVTPVSMREGRPASSSLAARASRSDSASAADEPVSTTAETERPSTATSVVSSRPCRRAGAARSATPGGRSPEGRRARRAWGKSRSTVRLRSTS